MVRTYWARDNISLQPLATLVHSRTNDTERVVPEYVTLRMKVDQRAKHTTDISILDEPLEHVLHSGVDLLHLLVMREATLPALDMLNERRDG